MDGRHLLLTVSIAICLGCGGTSGTSGTSGAQSNSSNNNNSSNNSGDGGAGASSSVSGTVGDQTFTSEGSIGAILSPTTCEGVSVAGIDVVVTDGALTCASAAESCVQRANSRTVSFMIANVVRNGQAQAVQPGTYHITTSLSLSNLLGGGQATLVSALLGKADSKCQTTASSANSGTITIQSVGADSIKGTVNDIQFADGSKISGSFTAPSCAVLGSLVSACDVASDRGSWSSCSGSSACN